MDHICGKDMRMADLGSAVRRQGRPSSFACRYRHRVVKSLYPSNASWKFYHPEEPPV